MVDSQEQNENLIKMLRFDRMFAYKLLNETNKFLEDYEAKFSDLSLTEQVEILEKIKEDFQKSFNSINKAAIRTKNKSNVHRYYRQMNRFLFNMRGFHKSYYVILKSELKKQNPDTTKLIEAQMRTFDKIHDMTEDIRSELDELISKSKNQQTSTEIIQMKKIINEDLNDVKNNVSKASGNLSKFNGGYTIGVAFKTVAALAALIIIKVGIDLFTLNAFEQMKGQSSSKVVQGKADSESEGMKVELTKDEVIINGILYENKDFEMLGTESTAPISVHTLIDYVYRVDVIKRKYVSHTVRIMDDKAMELKCLFNIAFFPGNPSAIYFSKKWNMSKEQALKKYNDLISKYIDEAKSKDGGLKVVTIDLPQRVGMLYRGGDYQPDKWNENQDKTATPADGLLHF